MLSAINLPQDKIKERAILLKRFLPQLEYSWPSEVKTKIFNDILQIPLKEPVCLDDIAGRITDNQLETIMGLSELKGHRTFRGKHYSMKDATFEAKGRWEEVRSCVNQVLKLHGKQAYALLKALIEIEAAPFGAVAVRAGEIYGEKIYPSQLIAELRDEWDLAWEVGSRQYPSWAMPAEIKPPVSEVLSEFDTRPLPKLSTPEAQSEFLEVIKMDEEFRAFLKTLLAERLDVTLKFGKEFSPAYLVNYLEDLFGPTLLLDHMLAIAQQYSICDSAVVSPIGHLAMNTGYNLALFGEPGTGKTFSVKDMVLGNESQGIPPYGLPGINRYSGGMTPAALIAKGEAYAGKKFNFIIPEFNEWFKHKGMVEPLKLLMERGTIRHETKTYEVGPYRFNSFFSVNYNTQVYERGYDVTISDPNFNAVEDRMLCRLHRLTKDKYLELAKSQRALMLGVLRIKMESVAALIRDHLTLVYAIQTKEPLVAGRFPEKRIVMSEDLLNKLENATKLILDNLDLKVVPFSMRLERRAIQLAAAMSLINYFNTASDNIPIDPMAFKMATRFFVEEAWTRSNEQFPLNKLLAKLDL